MYPTVNDPSERLRRKHSRWFKALFVLILGLFLTLSGPCPATALSDTQQLVVDSWRLVNQGYLDPDHLDAVRWRRQRQKALEKSIVSSEDAYGAIDGMLAQLSMTPTPDCCAQAITPHSRTAPTATSVASACSLEPSDQSDRVLVISALDGSPASDAELMTGTPILAVDGTPVMELGLEGTAAALRGEVGSQVVLSIEAAAGTADEVTLERRSVDLRPVRTRRLRSDDHTFGYLRITQFTDGVPEQVQQALEELQDKNIEGLLLDLRNNSGGLVSSGLAVADDFLSGGTIVETRNRDGIDDAITANTSTLYDGPMLTLVNGGTASASEILAGALQDNGRSTLLGHQTFGKGLIQTLTNLSDGSGLAVTVAGYVTPSGHDIQGEGIAPDRQLSDPEPLAPGGEGDRWISEAEQWMEALLEQAPDATAE